jgi:cardiolipin synthase A/B
MLSMVLIVASVIVTSFVTILLHNLSSGERKIRYELNGVYRPNEPGFARILGHLLGPPLECGNRVTPLLNGDQIFPAMLDAVRSAKKSITLETYIYWSGEVGRQFADVLAEKSRAGVKVHVLLDWFGSSKLDATALAEMEAAGVQIERYHPPGWSNLWRLNQRTHRKILVVDGRIGFIGGAGIADVWLGNADHKDHWRDSHFQVEGPVAAQLQAAFTDNWLKTRSEVLYQEDYFPELQPVGGSCAQVFKSSPREGSGSVRLMYLLSIAAARKRILLANSYFVPDSQAIQALVKAQQRGVSVQIIVPGPITDVQIVRRASRARWGKLLAAGVEIYEYQPTMYHCKVMVVDDEWVSVGSTNFDNRSFRLNDEANLNVIDRELAAQQAEVFDRDKQVSRQITLEDWQNRPKWEKTIEWLAAQIRGQL